MYGEKSGRNSSRGLCRRKQGKLGTFRQADGAEVVCLMSRETSYLTEYCGLVNISSAEGQYFLRTATTKSGNKVLPYKQG